MRIPEFTAEVSLYGTNGHYRTAIASSATTCSIRPAATRGQEGEVINVHSCPPGFGDIGGSCWPNPLTEPTSGGDGEDGVPTGGGPPDRVAFWG
jgi:hypothetical protein